MQACLQSAVLPGLQIHNGSGIAYVYPPFQDDFGQLVKLQGVTFTKRNGYSTALAIGAAPRTP